MWCHDQLNIAEERSRTDKSFVSVFGLDLDRPQRASGQPWSFESGGKMLI